VLISNAQLQSLPEPIYKAANYQNLTYYAIPHSHTDAGWWLTYEVYYQARAKHILSTLHRYMVKKYKSGNWSAESPDPFDHEKFLWADFAFFIKWWNADTTQEVRDEMKDFVNRGIISLEHGGMVQHDEALSDYKSITIMFDTSLQFIKENFGKLPKVGFSIDGFGHSSLTPYLLKALGHEAIVLYRMPYELYSGFQNDHQFFFTWEGDNEERIRVIRLVVYSLDERFNLDRSSYNYGTCFRNEDTCAEQFLETHVNDQMFNRDILDAAKPINTTDHKRMAFQTFGTDFAFQDA
jgi:hypothetical protein